MELAGLDESCTMPYPDADSANAEEYEALYLQSVYRLDTLDRACNEMRFLVRDMEMTEQWLHELRHKHSNLTKQINIAQIDLDKVDERQRKCNVVVFGLPESEQDPEWCGELVLKLVNSHLNFPLTSDQIVSAYRLKSPSNPRPILVKLSGEPKKWEVLNASGKLKGTGIGIREDFSYTVRLQRRLLVKKMHEERRAGRKACLNSNTLKVEGRVYVCDKFCENLVEVSDNGVRIESVSRDNAGLSSTLKLDAQCLSSGWLEEHSKTISDKIKILNGNCS
ncbi:hypothetical protein MRX96_003516 [Rhipicephalus microplus]|nr:uncharacterized protein LOC119178755 [Rhipicephalus microplus]